MPEPSDAHEIVHVLGAPSPQIEEEIASVSSVLQSWGYDVRAIGPLSRSGRSLLRTAGVTTQQFEERSGGSAGARWSDARALAGVIREARPALVHAHGFRGAFAGLLARGGGARPVPIVVSPHLLPQILREDARLGLRVRAYRWLLNRADAVVVPTEAQRDDLAELNATAADRAEIVPYARPAGPQPDSLDLGRRRTVLGITQSAVVVGCVVDGLAQEALGEFLDAAASVCMEYPSLEFALIGQDVDRERFHDLAHQRGLLGATVFVDPHERFRRAISALNVLVTPQRGWPSGMLALQAVAANVGVVAVEDGEVAEMLISNPRVTIAPAGGPDALGDAIIRRLHAAAQQMTPARDAAPETGGAVSMLVSKDFFDLEDRWATPVGRDSSRTDGRVADPAAQFNPTHAARALIGIYHRLFDES